MKENDKNKPDNKPSDRNKTIKPFPTKQFQAWTNLNCYFEISLTINRKPQEWEAWLSLHKPQNPGELPLLRQPVMEDEHILKPGIFYYYTIGDWDRVYSKIIAKGKAGSLGFIPLFLDDFLTSIGKDFPETREALIEMIQQDEIHRDFLPQLAKWCGEWVGHTKTAVSKHTDPTERDEEIDIIEEPWLKIPDYKWDRKAVQMMVEGFTDPEIAKALNLAGKTITNRLSRLRQQYPDFVPKRAKLRRIKKEF